MRRSEDMPVPLGTVLDGKYHVERVIGRGGMGVVYEGMHIGLERLVAIKVMRPSLSLDEDAVTRFDREARATSALTSKHIARVLDVGRSPDGDPYLVMEHLVGTTLQALVATSGRLTPERLVPIARDVARALADAHAAGIVHRDLKPANVFLGETTTKVLDFGIAKLDPSFGQGGITTTGSILGTPEYMSPEQLDTKRGVTPKTDVWSLGVTMYHALTGKTPFEAESFYELSIKVYAYEPTPITKHRTDLPPALVAIVAGCLQKDAKKRLSLDAVVEQLAQLSPEEDEKPLAPAIVNDATIPDGVPPAVEEVAAATPDTEQEPEEEEHETFVKPLIVAAPVAIEPPPPRRASPVLIAGIVGAFALVLLVVSILRLKEPAVEVARPAVSVTAVTPTTEPITQPLVVSPPPPSPSPVAVTTGTQLLHPPPRRRQPAAPKDSSGALTHER